MVVTPAGVVKYAAATDLSGGTDGSWTSLQVDATGNLRVAGSFSASLSGQTVGAAVATTAVEIGITDGTNLRVPLGDTSGRQVMIGAAASGAAVTGNPVYVAGSDGTNAQPLATDTSGRQKVVGAAATGATVTGNPVLVGCSDGTNAQPLKSDTSGRVTISTAQMAGTDSLTGSIMPVVAPTLYNGSGLDRWSSTPNAPLGGGRGCVALGSGIITALAAVTTTGASAARDWGVIHQNFSVQLTGTGTGIVCALQGCNDNATFVNLTPDVTDGGTIATNTMTATGLYYFRNRPVRYTKLNVTALSTGNLTANYGSA